MKFKKFVKSLASSGIIYKRGFDRWLASPVCVHAHSLYRPECHRCRHSGYAGTH